MDFKDLRRFQMKSRYLIFVDVTQKIAITAGEIRLKYDIPTADSLIAATGIDENVKGFDQTG